jgi:hypothetical protein
MGAGIAQYSDGLRAEWLGFDSWQGQKVFLYSTASRSALGLIQPPIKCVPGALTLGGKTVGA